MKLNLRLNCKQAGLIALSFCIGMLAGLVLPLYMVAILETAMLIILGYLCLFVW